MPKTTGAEREAAETMAIQTVSWMANDPAILGGFLSETGANLGSLAADIRRPEFLASVLDYILAEDQRVLALAAGLGIRPETIAQSRAHLPGGDLPNWT